MHNHTTKNVVRYRSSPSIRHLPTSVLVTTFAATGSVLALPARVAPPIPSLTVLTPPNHVVCIRHLHLWAHPLLLRSYRLLLRLLLELSRFRTVTTRTNLAQEFIEPYTVTATPFRIYRTVYPLVPFCS